MKKLRSTLRSTSICFSLLAPLFLFTQTTQVAQAAVSVYAMANYSEMHMKNATGKHTSGSDFGPGIGFHVDILPIITDLNLEVGGEFFARNTHYGTSKTKYQLVEVPVNVRYNIIPLVSVTGGAYLGYGVGHVGIENPTPGGTITTSNSYTEAGLDKIDYGIQAGVGLHFAWPFVEFRYSLGLRNLDKTRGRNLHQNDYKLLAGWKF